MKTGYCNCCGVNVPPLTDQELHESVGSVCRSDDITHTTRMTREEWRIQRLHEMADAFECAFGGTE